MGEKSPLRRAALRESLDPLLEVEGILGGVLCTDDGLPLARALKPGLDEESLAAAGAAIGLLCRNQLPDEPLQAAALDASRLRLVVRPVSLGYLTLAADPCAPIARAMELAERLAVAIDQTAEGSAESETSQS